MKSAFFFGALIALVISTQACVSIARADGCEVTQQEIGGRDYTRIYLGTGTAKHLATMDEVFDAMNVSGSTLFKDLKFVEGRTDQPLVYLDVPKEPFYYDIQSIPKQGTGDSRCPADQTGYECRVIQLKKVPETHGMPKGIKTGVAIAIPTDSPRLLARVGKSLGCDELYNVDGSAAIKGKGKAVPLVSPAGGTGTKP